MDISVHSQDLQVEDRSWDLTPPSGGFEIGGTIDVSEFTAETHYPNGYIPSGTVLAKVTSGGKFAPYNNGGAGGREVAACILKSAVRIVRQDGTSATAVGFAGLVHGVVDPTKMPLQSGTGSIDAAGKTDLKLIHFTS